MALLAFLPEIATFLIVFLMATQVAQVGPILVLMQLAMIGLLLLLRGRVALTTALRWWPLLLVPLLAMISTLWSATPAATFRYGLQFVLTAFVGILLARLLSPRRFVSVFLVAMFLFCIASILYGRQGTSFNGMVLIGLTGSKNQMGFAAQLLVMGATAMLLMRNLTPPMRWVALLSLPVGGWVLLSVESTTALLLAIGGCAVLFGLWFVQRLQPGGRLAALIGALVILTPLLLLIPEGIAAWEHFLYDTLDKDPTLTGRTFLWERADDLIARRPLLGYGYQSVWMGDSTETIALQRMTGISDGRLFHFHHQFRQTAVDTGIIGLLALCGMLIATFFTGMRQLLLSPTVPTSFFFVIFILMVARAFTDVIIQPFNVHTVIFFAACTYAFWKPAEEAAQAAAPQGWRPQTRTAG